jgi:hypothetical protein
VEMVPTTSEAAATATPTIILSSLWVRMGPLYPNHHEAGQTALPPASGARVRFERGSVLTPTSSSPPPKRPEAGHYRRRATHPDPDIWLST